MKKNLILIETNKIKISKQYEVKDINNGYLFQEKNNIKIKKTDLIKSGKIVASKKIMEDMLFALKICKHAKSNAIVLAKNNTVLGIGSGQTSRIGATKNSLFLVKNKKKIGFVAASDAFFPFTDSVKTLIKNNCKAIVQPSGSINDKKIVNLAIKNKLTLYFSKYRFFRH